jgi:outer membrane protein insertion porin family
MLGRDLAFSIDAGLSRSEASGDRRFGTQIYRLSPSLAFPVGEYSRLAVRYSFDRTTVYAPASASVVPRLSQDNGFYYTSSVGFTYTFDTRREGPNPDAGFVFRFSQDFAGLGGDRTWSRSSLLAGYQRRVFNGDVTLRAEFEAGAIFHRGGPSLITERFALNSDQFRGFSSYGLGPVGYGTDGSRNGLGGNYFAVARLEAEFPLGLPQEYNMRGGLFLDVGSLWGLDAPGPTCAGGVIPPVGTACVIDSNAIRATAGVSLFWGSPIGPLRFNFSTPLMIEAFDNERRFDLTIATNF